ncbi:MAG: protein-L-isoaspartate O-methyltransferase [Pseudomonadota bacterium]
MDFATARKIMVNSQIRPNDVTDPDIVRAFQTVPREAFVSPSKQSIAYSEFEISTGEGRAMWIPMDLAKMVKALDPKPRDIALVIGAGSGYSSALLAELTETVLAVEDSADAVARLTDRMVALGYDQVAAIEAPLKEGLPAQGPFDIILINGMVEHVPEALTAQLADGGRLGAVVKLDDALGRGRIWERSADTVSFRDVFDARPPEFTAFQKPKTFRF